VGGPEYVQQLLIRDLGGIEIELKRLGMIAEVVVSRVLGAAAGVTDARADDAGQTPELRVGVPESTQGKRGRFRAFRRVCIDRRHGGRRHRRRGATTGSQQDSPGPALHR
jgi:hypothetical protein